MCVPTLPGQLTPDRLLPRPLYNPLNVRVCSSVVYPDHPLLSFAWHAFSLLCEGLDKVIHPGTINNQARVLLIGGDHLVREACSQMLCGKVISNLPIILWRSKYPESGLYKLL